MAKFRNIQIGKLKGYRVSKSGLLKTPDGKIRRSIIKLFEGTPIPVQTFPELPGFGYINIRFL